MIQVGQKVYSILYGGRHGVVYAIHGEQRPQSVGSIAGILSIGGNAEFDIVFDDGTESRGLPEAILYGVQWKIFDEIVSAEEIKAMREFATSEDARKDAEAKKEAEAFSAAVSALRADPLYSELQQTGPENTTHGGKLVAINVRRQLKAAFPGTKFSVKSTYDSLSVTWTDGPTTAQVKAITMPYKAGYYDGGEDMYQFERSPWSSVFGSVKYIDNTRKHSVEAMTAAVQNAHKSGGFPLAEVKVSEWDGHAYVERLEHWHNKSIDDYLEKTGDYEKIAA